MAVRYTPKKTDYAFFRWVDGLGMAVDEDYEKAAATDPYIDMRYNAFDWHQGVGFDALLGAEETLVSSGMDGYGFVRQWLQEQLRQGLPKPNINTTAPFLCILRLAQRDENPQYIKWCEERALYLLSQAPRANRGAFEHTVIGIDHRFEQQMWADTMYMSGIFLARLYAHTGETAYAYEALRQALLHYAYLQDPQSKLLYHAYDCANRNHLSGVQWGRANGWGLLTCAGLLALLPHEWPECEKLRAHLQAHALALRIVQRENGGFGTVLPDVHSVVETTVACAYAAAVSKAIREGWLSADFIPSLQAANRYVLTQVTACGTVRNCSGGTPVMCDTEAYNRIPMVMSYYGQGLCMLALCEMLYR